MKEIPILFSTPMVQAILDGRKTMTRRMTDLEVINEMPSGWKLSAVLIGKIKGILNSFFRFESIKSEYIADRTCRYGQPGDVLWVREKWESESNGGKWINFYAGNIEVANNKAYERLTKWKPSIHMPKSAARIWLQVEEIRVERLQDISFEDAIAEGIHVKYWGGDTTQPYAYRKSKPEGIATDYKRSPIEAFRDLWEDINGAESWTANPWVWVVKYKVLSTTGKPSLEANSPSNSYSVSNL